MPGGARPGAGRPPMYESGTVSATLTLERAVAEALAAYAESEGMSRSQAASVLIREALTRACENP